MAEVPCADSQNSCCLGGTISTGVHGGEFERIRLIGISVRIAGRLTSEAPVSTTNGLACMYLKACRDLRITQVSAERTLRAHGKSS